VARGESPPISVGWVERPQPDSRAAPRGRCSSVEGRGMNICVGIWSRTESIGFMGDEPWALALSVVGPPGGLKDRTLYISRVPV